MALPLPGLDVPVIDVETGRMTQTWYSYFQAHPLLTHIATTAPTNGQVLIWNATTKLWTPAAN